MQSPSSRCRPTGAADSAALADADALAAHILAHTAPLRLDVAHTPAQVEQVFRLRYRVAIAHGWANPAAFPDGLERDAYDQDAIQIAAWHRQALAGTTRLVTPRAGGRLPTEQAFDLSLADRGDVIDLGRTCCSASDAGPHHGVLWALFAKAWQEARRHGFAQMCAIFSPAVGRLYRRLGFTVEPLAAPRLHWGTMRAAVCIRPASTVATLRMRYARSTAAAPIGG